MLRDVVEGWSRGLGLVSRVSFGVEDWCQGFELRVEDWS